MTMSSSSPILSLPQRKPLLPSDRRQRLGGYLFLLSLLIFFLSSILLYFIYAYSRRGDAQTNLPTVFLVSTACLLVISVLVHLATRTVRRDRHTTTFLLLAFSGLAALLFIGMQCRAMGTMLTGTILDGTERGIAGMVVVLALLHALHIAGGIIALGMVGVRSMRGRYDHERHWPVDFAAQYWHFLDIIWLFMLAAFWMTSGGF